MKCLVVEDDLVCSKVYQSYLSDLGACSQAGDGRRAVDAFRQALESNEPFDLICLDIMMPEMNGHEALQLIRDLEKQHGIDGLTAGVKVIIVTALDESDQRQKAFTAGCNAYLVKPIARRKLFSEIGRLGLIH